jgi:hypothetical protein
VAALALLLGGCAAVPEWQTDLRVALSAARDGRQELVVYFALPGREASDRMQRALAEPVVGRALAAGDFAAVVADGVAHSRLYAEWLGGGEGMGIAVLDAMGQVYAVRPGPQDPPELAAFLRRCAANRAALAAARAAVAAPTAGVGEQLALGALLLELGCRRQSEPLLLDAALAGDFAARHLLARLYALEGNVVLAERWLQGVPPTPARLVTEGYVRFKARRHADAVVAFERALREGGGFADRQRALLYLGKSLHELGRDERAVPLLEALAAEGTGSTFEAAAGHTLAHLRDPQHGHAH